MDDPSAAQASCDAKATESDEHRSPAPPLHARMWGMLRSIFDGRHHGSWPVLLYCDQYDRDACAARDMALLDAYRMALRICEKWKGSMLEAAMEATYLAVETHGDPLTRPLWLGRKSDDPHECLRSRKELWDDLHLLIMDVAMRGVGEGTLIKMRAGVESDVRRGASSSRRSTRLGNQAAHDQQEALDLRLYADMLMELAQEDAEAYVKATPSSNTAEAIRRVLERKGEIGREATQVTGGRINVAEEGGGGVKREEAAEEAEVVDMGCRRPAKRQKNAADDSSVDADTADAAMAALEAMECVSPGSCLQFPIVID